MTTHKFSQKNRLNFYELALLLADGQVRTGKEYSWTNFIDNLSHICDEFAFNIHPKEKPHLASLQSRCRPYRV